MKSEDYFLR